MAGSEDALVGVLIGASIVVGTAVAAKFRLDVGQIEVDPKLRRNAMGKGATAEDDGEQVEMSPSSKKSDVHSDEEAGKDVDDCIYKTHDIYETIRAGSESFLWTEYVYLAVFVFLFGAMLFAVKGLATGEWGDAAMTVLCFLVGATTSILAGYAGMRVATFSNARTTISAEDGLSGAFSTAFKGGGVMGFSLVTMGVSTLFLMYNILAYTQFKGYLNGPDPLASFLIRKRMMETLAAYGMGASCVALFARVGGGIYTKAADVGADLVGKIEQGIPEDDPRNPAVIADNVGDNVGDIAGMGADLFGSFAASTCAALLLLGEVDDAGSSTPWTWGGRLFPLAMSAVGIIAGALSCNIVLWTSPVTDVHKITSTLKYNEILSTLVSCGGLIALSFVLPDWFHFRQQKVMRWHVITCALMGLFGGLAIGILTEYYTSSEYLPVKEVAQSCRTGAATNIIYGLALGYQSTVLPAIIIAIIIFANNFMAGTLGVAIGTLGVLTTLTISLTIDAFGPICDNAGGIAEMAGLPHEVRDRTDALDAAGNTTAAIGKGFAIASAALVACALLGAFTRRVAGLHDDWAEYAVDPLTMKKLPGWDSDVKGHGEGWRSGNGIGTELRLLDPAGFAGLVVGSMLPYWFSAMTMKSVGTAAFQMVEEVRRQFNENPGIMKGTVKPDYHRCIEIATQASLSEGGPPGLLVILTPIISGFLFGTRFLTGVLAGALVSGVQMAISASNTGGAWDNAKKYIGSQNQNAADYLGGKGSEAHDAAIIGDTVGDPLKDTSGPALNILIKLMGNISVVFAGSLMAAERTQFVAKPYGLLGRLFE